MAEILTDIRKVMSMIDSGVDPDRYRFVVADGGTEAVESALFELGVKHRDIDLYQVNESAVLEPGQILIMDLEIMARNFQKVMDSWKFSF